MLIRNEADIIALIENDAYMMNILHAVHTLQLPDWWVCAGFVRSKVWDALHQFSHRTPLYDVDVIYFDKAAIDERYEKQLEDQLHSMLPHIPWSVKNEARMHLINDIAPYHSSVDAMSKFPETATAIGVALDDKGSIRLSAPCGIEDLLNMHVKPTPFF